MSNRESDQNVTIENKSEGQPIEKKEQPEAKRSDALSEFTTSVVEFAQKIPESISKAIERALEGRDFPIMVRVNQESLQRIDGLVEAKIFKSRSESAAFLIREGVKAQAALFDRIQEKVKEIEKLRDELKTILPQEQLGQEESAK